MKKKRPAGITGNSRWLADAPGRVEYKKTEAVPVMRNRPCLFTVLSEQ
ncbi:MAG: hypothetical protein MSK39_03560 [Dysosmobacter sp.]|nr:hypothetical protein [Dysosmobacter sp.]